MKRVLVVRWGEQTVGQLTQDEHGDLGFVYATAWLADPDAPRKKECRPFFAGLLPEQTQREVIARALGVVAAFAALDFDRAVVERLATFIGGRVAPCATSVTG